MLLFPVNGLIIVFFFFYFFGLIKSSLLVFLLFSSLFILVILLLNSLIALINTLIQAYGLIGLFFAAIIANATIIFGVPFELFIIPFVSIFKFNPVLVSLIAAVGASIGEFTGYAIGLGLIKVTEKIKKKQFMQIKELSKKLNDKGMFLIFFFSLTPIPFDFVGIACGLIKYNPIKFFVAAVAGRFIRYLLIALAVFYGLNFILSYFGITL